MELRWSEIQIGEGCPAPTIALIVGRKGNGKGMEQVTKRKRERGREGEREREREREK